MPKMDGRQTLRRWILRVHMYCGLLIAVYAVLIGLSGAVLVFRPELTQLSRPELYSRQLPQTLPTVPDRIVALAHETYPDWRPLSLTWPNEGSPSWMLYLLRGSEALEFYVDPFSGAAMGTR